MSPWIPSVISLLTSIILALGMTRVLAGVGEMLQARSRRRLYWCTPSGSRISFCIWWWQVDFLSLAQSAAVDVFPFYVCSDFAHDLIPGLHPSFSARVYSG
jgi:hypothetical protein